MSRATPFDEYLDARRREVDAALEAAIPAPPACPPRIAEAMRYSVFAGGKRLRPILTLAAAEAAGARGRDSPAPDAAARALARNGACAIELIHTYSLVHDDLPAMDDDTLRRGRPTSHVVFGEGLAILAGDALLTQAFVLLARRPPEAPPGFEARQLRAVARVAEAAGAAGMVGGQVLDLAAAGTGTGNASAVGTGTGTSPPAGTGTGTASAPAAGTGAAPAPGPPAAGTGTGTAPAAATGTGTAPAAEPPAAGPAAALRDVHERKTGALIGAAAVIGAILAGGSDAAVRAVDAYAGHLGLAFQIVDDVLDVEGSTAQLGKTAGKDAAAGKPTYPSVHGLDRSRALAADAADAARDALSSAGLGGRLGDIAEWVLSRTS